MFVEFKFLNKTIYFRNVLKKNCYFNLFEPFKYKFKNKLNSIFI